MKILYKNIIKRKIMDCFNDIKPDLINKNSFTDLGKVTMNTNITKHIEWNDNISSFYNNYIEPNLIALVLLVFALIFIVIKYIIKQDFDNSKKKKKKKKDFIVKYVEQPLPQFVDENNYETDDRSLDNISSYYENLKKTTDFNPDMIKQMERNTMSKLSFDEISKMIVSGESN